MVRGLIMALMALDHVRMFVSEAQFDPVDLEHTTPGYFFTRLITHLCAPGFFFIAGLSVWLQACRGEPRAALTRWLVIRGFWLIALELTFCGVAWSFSFHWRWLGVLWGLGAAMLLLALCLGAAKRWLFIAAAAFTLLHNEAWHLIRRAGGSALVVYDAGIARVPLLGEILVLYPVLPWAMLMLLGFASGPYLLPSGRPQYRRLAWAGAASIAAFAVLRLTGMGEPTAGGMKAWDWGMGTALAFLNVEKYPPSTQYTLLTLGVLGLLLAALARVRAVDGPIAPLLAFGRVPMFFYLLHLPLIHALALGLAHALHWPREFLFWQGVVPNLIPPDGYGIGLFGVYVAWLVVLLLLYPACHWFARVKRTRSWRWLRLL